MYFDRIKTPLGLIEVKASESGVYSIDFVSNEGELTSPNQLTDEACFQLKQYFEGHLTKFDLPLEPIGTPFQTKIWSELKNIPYGHTSTYGSIATVIGDPKKVRAVGNANGQNPIAIVIPCHRVVGGSGQLLGYAGGLHRKQWLLNFESANFNMQTSLF